MTSENPIITAIHSIAPDYQITASDRAEIDKAKDPQKVADWLKERVHDWRNDFARDVGCDPELIPLAVVIEAIDLSRAVKSYATGVGFQMASLGRMGNFRLARTVGHGEAVKAAVAITASFENHLGRTPRDGGLEYWLGEWRNGVTLEKIDFHISHSPEAKASQAT
jgi:hypothetical protein